MKKITTFVLASTCSLTFINSSFGMLIQKKLINKITNPQKTKSFCTKRSDFDLGKIIQCNKGTPAFTQELQTNITNTALLEKIIEQNKETNALLRAIIQQNHLIDHRTFNGYDQRNDAVHFKLKSFYDALEKEYGMKIE